MEVAIVLNELNRGGIGTYSREVIKYLINQQEVEHILVICSLGNFDFLPKNNKEKLKLIQHPIPKFFNFWPLKEIYLGHVFKRALDRLENYNIILNYSVFKSRFVKVNKIISIFHSLHLQYYYSQLKFSLLNNFLKICHRILSHLDLVRLNYSDINIFVSEKALNEAVEKYKFKRKNCLYLPAFIEIKDTNFKYDPKTKDIIYIGRLDPFKGLDMYNSFAKYIKTNYKIYRVFFIGSGLNYLKRKYKYITFLEQKNQSEINKIYQNSFLQVSTSYVENCPMIVLESIKCNLPILSSDVGDVDKILKKPYLFKKNSLESLIETFNHFIDVYRFSKNKINRDFTYSKKIAYKEFNKDHILNKLFLLTKRAEKIN